MHRARAPRSFALALTPMLAAAVYLGLPSPEAEAAKPKRGTGIHQGGYIMGTPGSVVVPFYQNDFYDLRPSFGWSFGGGYMFAPGKAFKLTIGGVFEHSVVVFRDYDYRNLGGHTIRIMPELRIGGGSDKVWGYGLFGVGPAVALWSWYQGLPFIDDVSGRDSAPGVNMQFGGGVQGIVWKNLFLGGEVDFDLGLYYWRNNDRRAWWREDRRNYEVFQVAFEFVIGWYF
jgi:hypothetical protein